MSIIFHIDVNSAFLSWTASRRLQEDPASVDLRTIPSIIGGDEKQRHGVVLAKSIPAKRYGIHTGEPVATALRKCPFLTLVPPDHALYRTRSRELMTLLHTYTSDIEQVSIDECYLFYTPISYRFLPRRQRHVRSQMRCGIPLALPSTSASQRTSCSQRWRVILKSRIVCTRSSGMRFRSKCGRSRSMSSLWSDKECFPSGGARHPYDRRAGAFGSCFSSDAFQKPRHSHVGVRKRHRSFRCTLGYHKG